MKTDDLIAMIFVFCIIPFVLVAILYLIHRAKHKERMALIEKGVDLLSIEKKDKPSCDVLFWGMLAGGIGIGLLIGFLLLEKKIVSDDAIQGILAILFGGISLVAYYVVKRKTGSKQD